MKPTSWPHQSVLLAETVKWLNVQKDAWYVDATLGAGGHTAAIAAVGGKVIAIDQDHEALALSQNRLAGKPVRFIHGNFSEMYKLVTQITTEPVAGILFDLGVSSMQFDEAQRGFSFQKNGPLDMRMDQTATTTAAQIINLANQEELYALFTTLAQEKRARTISEAIVRTRQVKPITTTGQLAQLIESVSGIKRGHLHPATKVFQALRMAVNNETEVLNRALKQTEALLKSGGRLLTISFHEGEDRIVKHFLKTNLNHFITLTKHPITPSPEEIQKNIRSRSAKLRVAEKI